MDSNSNFPLLRCVELTRELPAGPDSGKASIASSIRPKSGRSILSGVTFEVKAGAVLAVVGPSGSGKSTLLRLLNRLDEPTSGTVLLDGIDYRTIPARQLRRRVGMVTQRAYLFPGTVAENIAFGPRQVGSSLCSGNIEKMLGRVGLGGFAERSTSTLSGGEAQRVAITRALANSPELLLLDEPTSALDEAARDEVEKLLASLIREQNLTCVWVTHDPRQAARHADSVLRLEAGRLSAYGAVDDVLDLQIAGDGKASSAKEMKAGSGAIPQQSLGRADD
ncbi:MAG TPA: phosphate ABC transporter ATP-binding protein [Acidisarcina sp.]